MTDAITKCPKCNGPMAESRSVRGQFFCITPEKDCRIKELEKRLAPTSRRLKDGQLAFRDRVAELEWWIGVDEDKWPGGPAEIEAAYIGWKEKAEAQESKLRAREAEVLALRCVGESLSDMLHHLRPLLPKNDLTGDKELCYVLAAWMVVLRNTSATAQEITQRIEKEALVRALDRADRASRNCYSEPLYTDIGKAILGEEV